MSSSVLANMAIKLSAETSAFASGIKRAQGHLTQFQGTADKLKGVDLNSLKVSFDRQVNSLSSLQKAAREYGKALRHATDEKEIKALNAALEQTQVEMGRIKNLGRTGLTSLSAGSNAAAKGMDNLAGSALQVNAEFARIIQDAPFGMQGIGNNIQQLTANFGQLRATAGSTGGAIKAALASMITPASLLTLGVSALTAGWILYEKWAQKSAKATGESSKALGDAKQSTEEYIDSLDQLTRSRVQGAQDAQKELTTLRLLYRQTQNTSLSLRDRKKAVDELQRVYPSYFGNLKDEDILAGKASVSYDKLSKSILATAKARAAEVLIADNAKQQLLNEQKIVDLKVAQNKAEKEAQRRAATAAKAPVNGGSASGGAIAGQVDRDAAKQKQIINDIIGKRQVLELENIELQTKSLALEKQITAQISEGGSLVEESKGGGKVKEQTNFLKELETAFNQVTKEALVFGDSYDEMGAKATLFKNAIKGLLEQGLKPQSEVIRGLKSSYDLFSKETLPNATSAIKTFLAAGAGSNLQKLNTDLAATAASIKVVGVELTNLTPSIDLTKESFSGLLEYGPMITNALTSSFALLGETLGNMLTGKADAVGGFFDGILLIVADFAQTFGGALIAAGVASKAFQALITNPFAAIAAGGALIVAAGAVKSIVSAGPKGMVSGGGGGGGYSAPRPSYSGNSSNANNGPTTIYLRAEGRDLVGVLEVEQYLKERTMGRG